MNFRLQFVLGVIGSILLLTSQPIFGNTCEVGQRNDNDESEYIPFPLAYISGTHNYKKPDIAILISSQKLRSKSKIGNIYLDQYKMRFNCYNVYKVRGHIFLNDKQYFFNEVVYFPNTKEIVFSASSAHPPFSRVQFTLAPCPGLGANTYYASYKYFGIGGKGCHNFKCLGARTHIILRVNWR